MTESEKDPIPGVSPEESLSGEENAGKTAGAEEAGPSGATGEEPGEGGYRGLDPKTQMPRIPTAPETQEDPPTHDAAPDTSEDERDLHE